MTTDTLDRQPPEMMGQSADGPEPTGWIAALAAAADSLITVNRTGPAKSQGKPVELGIVGQLKPGDIETRDVTAFFRKFGGGYYETTWFEESPGENGKTTRKPHTATFRIPGSPRNLHEEETGIPPDEIGSNIPKSLTRNEDDEELELKRAKVRLQKKKIDAEIREIESDPGRYRDRGDDATKEKIASLERMLEKLGDRLERASERKPLDVAALGPVIAGSAQLFAAMQAGKLTPAEILQMQQAQHSELMQILMNQSQSDGDPLDKVDGLFNIFATMIDKFGGQGDSEKVAILKAANDIMRDGLPGVIRTTVDSFRKNPQTTGDGGASREAPKALPPSSSSGDAEKEPAEGTTDADIQEVLEFLVSEIRADADPQRANGWLLGRHPSIHGMVQQIPSVDAFLQNMKTLLEGAEAESYQKVIGELVAELETEEGKAWAADFLDLVKGKEPDGDEESDAEEEAAGDGESE